MDALKNILLIPLVAISLSACGNNPNNNINCNTARPSAFILTRGSFSMPHISMRPITSTPRIYTAPRPSSPVYRSAPPLRSYSAPRYYSAPVIVMQHHYVYHYSNPYFYYRPYYDPYYHTYYNGGWGFSNAIPANVNVTCPPTGT